MSLIMPTPDQVTLDKSETIISDLKKFQKRSFGRRGKSCLRNGWFKYTSTKTYSGCVARNNGRGEQGFKVLLRS